MARTQGWNLSYMVCLVLEPDMLRLARVRDEQNLLIIDGPHCSELRQSLLSSQASRVATSLSWALTITRI